ncbi:loganic acid O-methyltransferase-like [Rosa rugosa]|uniref:loganic acid O-methyltransferase-like n=1 Tax=Rosa rugosa TaxID=74645 RepID=UPI002B4086A2|nr:loganic acid O-methyltransferase-like [Rosa rugosa]
MAEEKMIRPVSNSMINNGNELNSCSINSISGSVIEEAFPMNGGDGQYSYGKNSNRQRKAADNVKAMLVEAILENLQIGNLCSTTKSNSFCIADFGCSVGPNTFIAVNNIIETVTQKFEIEGQSSLLPEFHVYFNDHVSNDFNILLSNLPQNQQYYAAGVPGSFHGKLFPKASLNFAYSAYSVLWLSKAPQTCNKGRIYYSHSPKEVSEAYSFQFANDFKSFLDARAQEVVPGGLMVLLISGRPDGTLPQQYSLGPLYDPVESCLLDMVDEGLLSVDKIDSFNMLTYSPSMEEVRMVLLENGCFEIARLEEQPPMSVPLNTTQELRAGMESIITKHFGCDIVEPLFDRYSKKIAAQSRPPLTAKDGLAVGLFILLKRRK